MIALLSGVDARSPQAKHRVDGARGADLERIPRSAGSATTTTPARRRSSPRTADSTYLAVALKPTGDKQRSGRRQAASQDRLEGTARRDGRRAGRSPSEQVNKQVESDLRRAELLAFPLLFLLSLLFFRSLVAALLPPLIGGLAIVGTFLMLRVASEFTSMSIFALNLVTGLGLGLAIDYSLFIVSRYREEIARSRTRAWRRCAARWPPRAGPSSSRSLTVAAALASLLIFPQRFLYSMGIGGSLVALIAAGRRARRAARDARRCSARASTRSRPRSCSGAPSATRARRERASGTGSRAS